MKLVHFVASWLAFLLVLKPSLLTATALADRLIMLKLRRKWKLTFPSAMLPLPYRNMFGRLCAARCTRQSTFAVPVSPLSTDEHEKISWRPLVLATLAMPRNTGPAYMLLCMASLAPALQSRMHGRVPSVA